jgi:hypothetical protein
LVKATESKSKFLTGYFDTQYRKQAILKRLDNIARDDHRDSDYQDRLEEERLELEKELACLNVGC